MRPYNHLLIFAATILTMVGCMRTDIYDQPEVDQAERAISFATFVQQTRADITTDTSFEQSGSFNVATFLTNVDNSPYYTDEVSYNGSSWTSGRNRYWPVNDNLNMIAYSPIKDIVEVQNSGLYSSYSLRYSCPSDIDDQIDLLVGTLENQSYEMNDEVPHTNKGRVELLLKHVLSGIKFTVEIIGENNVTLNNIDVNYINIQKEGTFDCITKEWLPEATPICFDTSDGLTNTIEVNENKLISGGSILFDKIDDQLMIIPQSISELKNNPHYLSIHVSYSLIIGGDKIAITTGVMPLPAPNEENKYKKGEIYTYNIIINGDKITFGDVTIEDQEPPKPAYGNIDLGLITNYTDPYTIPGYTPPDTVNNSKLAQLYYTTSLRVKRLLDDGVRDFVVVGSVEATKENGLGTGKIGYYGGGSSAFNIGASVADLESSRNALFSVDLRGTYGYPEFQYSGQTEGISVADGDLLSTDKVLLPGMFYEVKNLREVILPHGIKAISDHAFANCDGLTTIDIADVKHIEEGAFQFSSALTEVKNGALTRIHHNGFDRCTNLTTIDLSQVTRVDSSGFVKCEKLTDVNLSELKKIGTYAFEGCTSLTLKKDTEIPAFESVADFAFSGCSALGGKYGAHIDLTNATLVGDHAFNECYNILLASGNLNKMKIIRDNAFADCAHIGRDHTVYMPLIDSIGKFAFQGCSKLNIVQGLERLSKIADNTFEGCTSLTGYVEGATDKTISLPLVDSVGDYGFCRTDVASIAFDSNKLTTVGDNAFDGCSSLTTLTGLGGVTSVGNYAFSSCSSLTELELPLLTNEHCGGEFFYGCKSLTKISLPRITNNDISWTGKNREFHYSTVIGTINAEFTVIEQIDMPRIVVDLPGWQFKDKTSLQRVDFSAATAVGDGTFIGCSNLTEAKVAAATSVGWQSFNGCSSLASINLPLATSVGEMAFNGCSTLSTASFSSTALTTIGKEAFSNCSLLSTLTGLGGVTTIGNSAFSGCSSIETFDLPSATSVGEMAFMNCTKLKSANFDSSKLTTIGAKAFLNSSVASITGLGAVNTIGKQAFKGCSSLKELILPLLFSENCGDDFFSGCSSLTTISIPNLANNDISWYDDEGTYHYVTVVTSINSNIEVIDLPALQADLPGWHFQNKSSLRSVDFSAATSVGGGLFYGCSNLEVVKIANANSIGEQAFRGCSSIETLYCPQVTTIGGMAFMDCSALEVADFSAVTSVGSTAFQRCSSLRKLNLSKLVASTQIGAWAFADIPNGQCELWLSAEQAPNDGTTVWQGVTWKEIHVAGDGAAFTMD